MSTRSIENITGSKVAQILWWDGDICVVLFVSRQPVSPCLLASLLPVLTWSAMPARLPCQLAAELSFHFSLSLKNLSLMKNSNFLLPKLPPKACNKISQNEISYFFKLKTRLQNDQWAVGSHYELGKLRTHFKVFV